VPAGEDGDKQLQEPPMVGLATPTRVSDATVRQQVMDELRWDPRVDERGIEVDVTDGVVWLRGRVKSFAQKLASRAAAHRVVGVLDVADDVKVEVPATERHSDVDLAKAVRGALEWSVFVPDNKIHSTVIDGWVTLDGSVGTLAQRADAVAAVERLEGVQGVVNQIIVESPIIASARIKSDIERALSRQSRWVASGVHLEVDDGVVTLCGEVQSWSDRHALAQVAASAPGVRQIVDRLSINPGK
jgi:osmotically-inducible protein OsmY